METAHSECEDILEAGTGFMVSVTEILHYLTSKGYTENLTPKEDHFECRSGEYKIYPQDIRVDKTVRFENSSDPDDQAIVYAISSNSHDIKGVYVESYGIYQDSLSKEMLERLKTHYH